jgi:hypothetical protein
MLHGLFLRLGGNHLLAGRGFGGHFAAHLVGVGVQLGFLHALVLELQRVAHLLGRQLLGQQAVHAPAVLGGQIHLADLQAAQRDAIGRQAGAQLGFDDLRNLGTLGREDFTHGVAGKHLVDQALHSGLDDVGAYVVGQVACFDGGRVGVQGVAHAQVQPQRQPFHRLQRRAAGGLAHGFGAVALVTQENRRTVCRPGTTHTLPSRHRLTAPVNWFSRTPRSPCARCCTGGLRYTIRPAAATTAPAASQRTVRAVGSR